MHFIAVKMSIKTSKLFKKSRKIVFNVAKYIENEVTNPSYTPEAFTRKTVEATGNNERIILPIKKEHFNSDINEAEKI